MRELSMHILDIVQNSISADSTMIEVIVSEEIKRDKLYISIKDNGRGMDEETLKKVVDPFYTSRTTRKVGLGIPMFKRTAVICGGDFDIKSQVGVGTSIEINMQYSHIDRPPIGNMADTVMVMVNTEKNIEFIYTHKINDKEYVLDTRVLREVLGEVPLTSIDVLFWIKENVKEGITELKY